MAYWNVFQRKLDRDGGRWVTDSGELKFFHFSGLADDLTQVSRHQNRITAPTRTPLHELLTNYRRKIGNNLWTRYGQHAYSFGYYSDGQTILSEDRRVYLHLDKVGRDVLGDPFEHRRKLLALRRKYQLVLPRSLCREYLAAIRVNGFIRATLIALSFLARRLARRLGRLFRREI